MILLDLLDDFVQVGDEFISIDSVRHCALFNIFKPGGDAAQTAHAEIHEDFSSLRVFLHHIDNAHGFFNGSHCQHNHMLIAKVYHSRDSSVLLDFLILLQ